MEGFNGKIRSVIWKARDLKWGKKQVEQMQDQWHKSRSRYLVQWIMQPKPQVQEDQSKVWKGWRLT